MKLKPFILLLIISLICVSGYLLVLRSSGGRDENTDGHSITSLIDGSVVPWDLTSYANDATAIVVGSVESLVVDQNAGGQLFAKFKISEVVKGKELGLDLNILMLEGQVIDGAWDQKSALLQPGENTLLFLGMNAEKQYVVYAGINGKFLIAQDGSLSGSNISKTTLADFEAQIRQVIVQSNVSGQK